MAETIKALVPVSQLKTDYLTQVIKDRSQVPLIDYDAFMDTLMLLFVSTQVETVVHHLDKHVALLVRPETQEIVGLQIEDFEHSFIPEHEDVRRVWRLREANSEIEWPEDFGDIVLMIERMKPRVLQEVMRAAASSLDELPSLQETARTLEFA